MFTKKRMVVLGTLVLASAFIWTISEGPLWNRSKEVTIPPSITVADTSKSEANIGLPKVEYGYTTSFSTPLRKGDTTTPPLDRPVVIPSSFSPETADSAKKEVETLIASLKKNPSNAALWARLGMTRKGIEDYEGAKEAYEYAHKLVPKDSVIADNIGVMYGDYLKNYPKAEEYYRLAITLDPKTQYRYLRLFEFYRYLLKDSAKARAILEEGLRTIPGEPSFTSLLETL